MGMAYPVAKGEDAWTTLDSLSGVAGTNSFPAGRKVACASPALSSSAAPSMRAFFPKSALALLFMLFMTSNFERRGWIYNKEKWFKTLGS
jgi:hypothetical protein